MWTPPTPPWAANPPPGQERHRGEYAGTSPSVIGVGLLATILAFVVVCMRLYSRVFSARGLKADDYLIIPAMGFLAGFFAVSARLTAYGTGLHIWDVYMADYSPGILQLVFFAQVTGCMMVSLNKLSVLSLYFTITKNQLFRAAVFFLMGVTISFSVTYILAQLLDCTPVEAQWDSKVAKTAHCIDADVSPMLILSIVNILVDVAVVVLPIPVILPLNLPKKDKASCLLLFAAGGGLVCIAAIGRTVQLIPLLQPQSTGVVDVTQLIVPELNWAAAEGSTGIIASSLPAVRPLFKRMLCKLGGTGDEKNDRSGFTLEKVPKEDKSSKARGHHCCGQSSHTDEELGLCPCRDRSTQDCSTRDSDKISSVSHNPAASAPRSDGHLSRDLHARGWSELGGRRDVIIADFAVAH